MRIEPPPSEPCARGPSPAAIAEPAPPDEPPDVRSSFQGFRHAGPRRLSQESLWPRCGVFVLPRRTAPVSLSRAATTPSSTGTWRSNHFEPKVVRMPAVGSRSFSEYGMPSSGPSSVSRRARSSAGASLGAGEVGRDREKRVQLRVQPLDAGEDRIAQLDRRELPARIRAASSRADVKHSSLSPRVVTARPPPRVPAVARPVTGQAASPGTPGRTGRRTGTSRGRPDSRSRRTRSRSRPGGARCRGSARPGRPA